MLESDAAPGYLELSTEMTVAWLGNPNTRASADEVHEFFEKMCASISRLEVPHGRQDRTSGEGEYEPAVSVRRSLASKDHIISLIDGKPYKTLKRHLSAHGLTPTEYRERYGLRPDYPMVAESYAAMRRGLAKRIGLGGKTTPKQGRRTAGRQIGSRTSGPAKS